MVGIDHASTTVFATEAYTLSTGPPISVPVTTQLGFASRQGSETSLTVSDHVVIMIVVTN